MQRHVLYLGEINDSQMESWCRTVEILEQGQTQPKQVALCPENRKAAPVDCDVIHVRTAEMELHRLWYSRSAMGDLLGEYFSLVQIDKLYRCMDKLLTHKKNLFSFLRERWGYMFAAGFDVLFYDLTSTYFECDAPKIGKRKFGYGRDKRPDCVQVVIALIVTPDGFPIAYEVMEGNFIEEEQIPGDDTERRPLSPPI